MKWYHLGPRIGSQDQAASFCFDHCTAIKKGQLPKRHSQSYKLLVVSHQYSSTTSSCITSVVGLRYSRRTANHIWLVVEPPL